MKNWESTLIKPQTTILDAITIINSSPFLIALVVDDNRKLIGTVTDGDIRRGLLRKESIDSPVERIMFKNPLSISINDKRKKIINLLKLKRCLQIPIVDNSGCVVDLKMADDFIQQKNNLNSPVLIMAGGLGSRLRPLTNDCPKPLLNIGDKPILEIILDNFIDYNFKNFYISINYKGDMIEKYFKDGSNWGINIQYLKEKKRLGTAGAISLIKDEISDPLIIMNGDLLTKINFQHLIKFHNENNAKATLCVREYDYQIPFGVVQIDNYKLKNLKEKPIQKQFINAGIYVLGKEAINLIPKNRYFDMTEVFSELIERKESPAVFPIHEDWQDIGHIKDYKQANAKYIKKEEKLCFAASL